MPKPLQSLVHRLFSIFFILITSVMVMYSFGFRINWDNRTVESSSSLKIRTVPSSTVISPVLSEQTSTPATIDIRASGVGQLELAASGYTTESVQIDNFFDSPINNSIDPVHLFPSDPSNTIFSSEKRVYFVGNQHFLEWDTQTRDISIASLANPDSRVLTSKLPENISPIDLDPLFTFSPIGNELYWNATKEIILKQSGSQWTIHILKKEFSQSIVQLASYGSWITYLTSNGAFGYIPVSDFLSAQGSDLEIFSWGARAIYTEPTTGELWLMEDSDLYRFSPDIPPIPTRNLLVATDINSVSEPTTRLSVRRFDLGYILHISNALYYWKSGQSIQLYTNSAISFTTVPSGFYWLNPLGEIWYSRINIGISDRLAILTILTISSPLSGWNIYYDPSWRRIFLVNPAGISYHMWHDHERTNSIVRFQPQSIEYVCGEPLGLRIYCIDSVTRTDIVEFNNTLLSL